MDVPRRSSLDEAIRVLEGGPWYRRVEVAGLLGVTPAAVLAISQSEAHPDFYPAGYMEWAGKVVHLWDKKQLEAMREHFNRANAGAGRPRLWSLDESKERRRRYDLVRYYAKRATELREAGRSDEADSYDEVATTMRAALDQELAERKKASGVTE